MTVYIAEYGISHEGSDIFGVFDTPEKAFDSEKDIVDSYDSFRVFETELNKINEGRYIEKPIKIIAETETFFTVEELSSKLTEAGLINGSFFRAKWFDGYIPIQQKKSSGLWNFEVSSETYGNKSLIYISFMNRFHRDILITKFNELGIIFNPEYFSGRNNDLFEIRVEHFKGYGWDS